MVLDSVGTSLELVLDDAVKVIEVFFVFAIPDAKKFLKSGALTVNVNY